MIGELVRHTFLSGHHELTWSSFPGGLVDVGRAMICLPGCAPTAESFAPLAPLAARFDVRPVTFDEDDRDAGFDLIGSLARRALEFSREFDRPIVLGAAFGGMVALRVAANPRSSLRGLILVSSCLTGSWFDRQALHLASYDAATARAVSRVDLRSITPTIRIPTLVVHGSEDGIVPLAAARQLAAALSGARLHVIDGAGHLPHLTHADEVNTIVGEFAEQLFEA